MAYTEEFNPAESELEGTETSGYPALFGITITPAISGAIAALLGIGAAAYMFVSLVQPAWDSYQKLEAEVQASKQKIAEQRQKLKEIEQAKAKLDTAKKQQIAVLSLFGNEQNLDTLLLDLNRQIDARKAKLLSYKPVETKAAGAAQQKNTVALKRDAEIVSDSSVGSGVNGKLKRKSYNLEFVGTLNQVQSSLRSIESLQNLLIIKDFKLGFFDKQKDQLIVINQGKINPKEQPEPKIKASLKLQVLLPLKPQEAAQLEAASQAQQQAASKGKPTPTPAASPKK